MSAVLLLLLTPGAFHMDQRSVSEALMHGIDRCRKPLMVVEVGQLRSDICGSEMATKVPHCVECCDGSSPEIQPLARAIMNVIHPRVKWSFDGVDSRISFLNQFHIIHDAHYAAQHDLSEE